MVWYDLQIVDYTSAAVVYCFIIVYASGVREEQRSDSPVCYTNDILFRTWHTGTKCCFCVFRNPYQPDLAPYTLLPSPQLMLPCWERPRSQAADYFTSKSAVVVSKVAMEQQQQESRRGMLLPQLPTRPSKATAVKTTTTKVTIMRYCSWRGTPARRRTV